MINKSEFNCLTIEPIAAFICNGTMVHGTSQISVQPRGMETISRPEGNMTTAVFSFKPKLVNLPIVLFDLPMPISDFQLQIANSKCKLQI